MSTLFISDLHLNHKQQAITDLFIRFLQSDARHADSLYILGDLFDMWIGDDYIPPGMDAVIHELQQLREHVAIYLLLGNRDFLLGERFKAITGCEILADPIVIDLYGTPTLLSHGDILCTDDVAYQVFRHNTRRLSWREDFLNKSVKQRLEIANEVRSESNHQKLDKSFEIMDVNQNSVALMMREHAVQRLIHGHTHRPGTHHFELDGQQATRIVLGDWNDKGYVLHANQSACRMSTIQLDRDEHTVLTDFSSIPAVN